MTKKEILDYIIETPGNTNRAVLDGMLDSFEGGSGGSSDFSTATVTIVNNTSTEISCDGAWIITYEGENGKQTKPSLSIEGNGSITSTIIIADLGASIFIHPAISTETTDALSCTTTGSVIDYGYGTLKATGDCTITLVSI